MTEEGEQKREHIDVSMTQRQAISLPLILQTAALLAGLAGIYATGVANDRELTAKHDALEKRVEMMEADSRSLKSDLRSDLKEIKTEVQQMRQEMSEYRRR